MARRYDQLLTLIAQVKPTSLVEVGVHRGKRSALMCQEALKHRPPMKTVTFLGFDVFHEADAEFHRAAMNGKGPPREVEAREKLQQMVPLLEFDFVTGDTRKTLHGHIYYADFAFIDGDHRTEVIRGDYDALKGSTCVVLDDYYRPGHQGQIPDLERYGANKLVTELVAEGRRVEVLPIGDVCDHGAISHLVVVWK